MLVLREEGPKSLWQVPNALDASFEEGTEFTDTPEENLLGVATVLLRDLEKAGFVSDEVARIAGYLQRLASSTHGGQN